MPNTPIPVRWQKLDHLRRSIDNMMFHDLDSAFQNRAFVGALILGVCAIDTMAALRFAKDYPRPGSKKPDDYVVGDAFKRFANEYLPRGDQYTDDIYEHMRCELIHNYSTVGFIYVDNNSQLHLQPWAQGGLIINVDDFVAEVKQAGGKYLTELYGDVDPKGDGEPGPIYVNFEFWFDQHPTLSVSPGSP